MHTLFPYNSHACPYCLELKSHSEIWDECIFRQSKIIKKCSEGIFYGMCYAGIEEYVISLIYDSSVFGFISVSGYCTNYEEGIARVCNISSKYNLDKEHILDIYNKSVKNVLPSKTLIRQTVGVLARLMELLCIKVIRYSVAAENSTNADIILNHILLHIARYFNTPINLSQIATTCNCSKSYISHLFKKRMGKGISTYINEIRIIEAKRLLKETELSIQEIAGLVGIYDANYFSNLFKRLNKISPMKYRNLQRTVT